MAVPKLMFTVFNGGKSTGSKVKFRRFYLIMDLEPKDVEIIDAQLVYYKFSAAV